MERLIPLTLSFEDTVPLVQNPSSSSSVTPYTPEGLVPICFEVNDPKESVTQEEFASVMQEVILGQQKASQPPPRLETEPESAKPLCSVPFECA